MAARAGRRRVSLRRERGRRVGPGGRGPGVAPRGRRGRRRIRLSVATLGRRLDERGREHGAPSAGRADRPGRDRRRRSAFHRGARRNLDRARFQRRGVGEPPDLGRFSAGRRRGDGPFRRRSVRRRRNGPGDRRHDDRRRLASCAPGPRAGLFSGACQPYGGSPAAPSPGDGLLREHARRRGAGPPLRRAQARPADVVTFSYSLTMIPNWFAALENARAILKPGGLVGVVDFYVSRKYPADGLARHAWFTRSFWPVWFARDNVFPSPDHVPFLQRTFDPVHFTENRAKVPYLPLVRMPYYTFVGKKR
ncbi:MAG: methyltransferase domain-containing protein [Planctomycetota bacterium]